MYVISTNLAEFNFKLMDGPKKLAVLIIIDHLSHSRSTLVSSEIIQFHLGLFGF